MSATPPSKPHDLETLASARFGDLSEGEVKLLHAAGEGEMAWCGPGQEDDANDPSEGDPRWGPEREVRAELIRWLCIDRQAAEKVDPRGIRIHAARVKGKLDLSFATVPFPLGLFRCHLTDGANLRNAHIPALSLLGSWTRPLDAHGIRVAGNVVLSHGFTAEGEVRLLGAEIGGSLVCDGGAFKNPGVEDSPSKGVALHADGIKVSGAVLMRRGFAAEGEVRLLGGQIGVNLECDGGSFKNSAVRDLPASGVALRANGTKVGGDVLLRQGFTAEGEVALLSAQIGGSLVCDGGAFKNPAVKGLPTKGVALHADGIKVSGAVLLRNGFTAEGEVRLLGGQIGINLECDGGSFKNAGGCALSTELAQVTGSVLLRQGFAAEGVVRLVSAQIGGSLDCHDGAFTDLTAQRTTIKRNFLWQEIQEPKVKNVDLRNASAGTIADDAVSWPAKGDLWLDGFTYSRFTQGPRDAQSRLRWLERLNEFTPQPYRQLSNVLHEAGDERGAHEVLYEMEKLRREQGKPRWYQRSWSWVLRWTVGYGHKTWRVLWWLLGLTAIGFALSGLAYLGGAVAPSQKDAFEVFNSIGATPAYYPRFNAAAFSFEHSFPFIDLGERNHWAPAPGGSWRTPVLAWSAFQWMRDFQVRGVHPFRLNAPGFLRLWLWFQIAAGWVLATLFVAGLTGIVKSR